MTLDESSEEDLIDITENIEFVMSAELEDFGEDFTVGIDADKKIYVVSNDHETC